MFWLEGGPSKAATLLSTGVQGTRPQLLTQSRQGRSSRSRVSSGSSVRG